LRSRVWVPLFLDLSERCVVVFGGGVVATRRVEKIVKSCRRIVVVSADFTEKLRRLALRYPHLSLVRREVESERGLEGYLKSADLVVAATDDPQLNSRIAAAGGSTRRLVNRVDSLVGSNVIFPAVFRKGDVTVAVSTGGRSPLLSKILRQRLAETVTETDVRMARLLDYSKRLASRNLSGEPARRRVMERVAADPLVKSLLERGSLREAEARARRIILDLD
jgi:precorrin-2 dehydrogenase/sirohydrochlorin ferrochelatase